MVVKLGGMEDRRDEEREASRPRGGGWRVVPPAAAGDMEDRSSDSWP